MATCAIVRRLFVREVAAAPKMAALRSALVWAAACEPFTVSVQRAAFSGTPWRGGAGDACGDGQGNEAEAVRDGDVEALRRIVHARRSAPSFDPSKPVSTDVIDSILAMTLRAPTSFNLQPFRVVVVREEGARRKLADAMTANNVERVLAAPVSFVFAADLAVKERIRRIVELERDVGGKPPAYLERLPLSANIVAGDGSSSCGELEQTIKSVATRILSPVTPLPQVTTTTAWAFKNTSFAAQTLLLAATAHGVDTSPMEGLDSRRVCAALGLPERQFEVAVVVAAGHASKHYDPSPRLPVEELVSLDTFHQRYPDWSEQN